jgi:hypothetical protein
VKHPKQKKIQTKIQKSKNHYKKSQMNQK